MFTLCHDKEAFPARYRPYQTASPRVYDASNAKVARIDRTKWVVMSMSDESIFGPVAYRLAYRDAVEQKFLSDYRIIAIGVGDREWAAANCIVQLFEQSPETGGPVSPAAGRPGRCGDAHGRVDRASGPRQRRRGAGGRARHGVTSQALGAAPITEYLTEEKELRVAPAASEGRGAGALHRRPVRRRRTDAGGVACRAGRPARARRRPVRPRRRAAPWTATPPARCWRSAGTH